MPDKCPGGGGADTWNWLSYDLSVRALFHMAGACYVQWSERLTVQSHRISLTLSFMRVYFLLLSKENNIDEVCFRIRSHSPSEPAIKEALGWYDRSKYWPFYVVYSFSGHNYHPCVWNFVLPTVCLYDNRPQASWVTCGISLRFCMVSHKFK